jgi:dipeptidase E
MNGFALQTPANRGHHAEAERWAAEIAGPAYAIDDQTAIKMTDGTVEVVSEGCWEQFPS